MPGCTTLWPNLLRVRLGIAGRKCPAVVTWHITELPLPAPSQCQPAQRETSATPQAAAAERFSEKVAAKGANITSSLQPL